MPADSDPKTVPASGSPASTEMDAVAPATRPLLSDLAARLASAVKGFRRESQIHESLEEVIEESDRETQDLSSQERMMLANLLRFGEISIADKACSSPALSASSVVTRRISISRSD